jgi:outer membrane protein insertion porin family
MLRLPSLALAVLVMAAPLAAQDQSGITGRCLTPDSLDVRGNARVSREAVLASSGLAVGGAVNFPAIQRSIRDLFSTGDFDEVDITCDLDRPTGATLVIAVKERPLLATVDVQGPSRISSRSVQDRVELLLGRPVDPAKVALAMKRIDSLYQANGYYLARVTPETTQVGDRIGITFRVDEGRRLAISGIRIDGNAALSDAQIVGTMKTKPEGFLWFRRGEFDEDKFATDLGERIPKLFAERGYVDFQLDRDTLMVDRERGKAMIQLDIREGEQYRVRQFEVVGNRRFSTEQIAALYPFTDRAPSLTERGR